MTVAAIALALTVAVTTASLVVSPQAAIASYFAGGFLASDLSVSAVATEGGWLETPLPDRVADELRTVPGVRQVEMLRIFPGHLYRGQRIAVAGLSDGLFEPSRYPTGWFREGDPASAAAALRSGEGVNVSRSLSDRFGLHLGDVLALESPTGPVSLRVVGVIQDYMSDRGAVAVSRRLLERYWDDRSVNRLSLFLEDGASIATVREHVQQRLGGRYRLKVLSVAEVVRYHSDAIDRAFSLMDAIQLLVVIVAVAGVLDLLLSAILERRRELGVWRLVGADERAVRRSVVIESATIGVCGSLLGLAVGAVTAWIWVGVNFRYLLALYLDYRFPVASAAWFVGLAMTMTMLAGYLASTTATRQSILDGIRAE